MAQDLEPIRSRLLLTELGFLRRSMLNDAGGWFRDDESDADDVESLERMLGAGGRFWDIL